jgi:hypothetical protein
LEGKIGNFVDEKFGRRNEKLDDLGRYKLDEKMRG